MLSAAAARCERVKSESDQKGVCVHVRSSNWEISYSLFSSQPGLWDATEGGDGTHVSSLRGLVSSSLL